MDITTYVLVKRNQDGELSFGKGRHGICDLPVGFEPKYAEFLFEFAESRIHCQPNEEILLMKGNINTDDIEKRDDFINAFKHRLQNECDFSNWQIVSTKSAMGIGDTHYQEKLLRHLRERHGNSPNRRQEDQASYSAVG